MAVATFTDFNPPFVLRHPHVQNFLSSLGLRHRLLHRRTDILRQHTKSAVVNADKGVRLSGELSVPPPTLSGISTSNNNRLAILIHGWEGCSQSAYMISAALTLFEAGFTVFRLNLRDHGDSHHLNEGIFNSTLLDEVIQAIADIQNRWPHQHTFLAGFSLGGNFVLRIALNAPQQNLSVNRVAAVCPVIDPAHTLHALETTLFVYEKYFVKRWRNSLLKKLAFFPHYNYQDELQGLKSLRAMHEFFVPRFTPFKDPDEYFSAYALSHKALESIAIPTHIITSEDDPITKAETLPVEIQNPYLFIHRPRYGSHCAFLQDFELTSWVDDQLLQLFSHNNG